jgi:hypothetical protein
MFAANRRQTVSRIASISAGCLVLLGCSFAGAMVGDPQIMTDHPVYRGELSCSTLDRNIADAYRIFQERYGHQPKTETEKLFSLWTWKVEHGVHSADNWVYVGPDDMDSLPDGPAKGWMDNRDCQMNQFSYGFALCYSIHAQMSAIVARALDNDLTRVRCPAIGGHTPFEAFVDGKWALADFTTGMMVFDDDGKAMSIDQIIPHAKAKDTKWLSDPKRGGPYKLAMGPFGDSLDGYQQIVDQQKLFGFNGMPIVYSLRAGESFTRYLDPGLEDGKTFMFWAKDYFDISGKPVHGPHRTQTFLDRYPVGNGNGNPRFSMHQANGVFEYALPLADGRYKEGARTLKDVAYSEGVLRGKGEGAVVVFEHTSPYVIAAWPEKRGDREWKLLEEKCVDGAVASGTAAGKVPVKVSIDGGQTWTTAGIAQGEFKVDFTDIVKGRHFYLVSFGLSPQDGLKSLNLRTVVQVARGVVPRLKDGGTKVTYQAGGAGVIQGGPSQFLADRLRRKDLETEGVRVMEIKAPGAIQFASGVLRASGPGRGPWSVAFSLDDGKTWKVGLKDVNLKPEESGWGGGHHAYAWAEMAFPDNKDAKSVLVKVGKGNISHAEVYATYQQPDTSAVEVTYGWTEAGQTKTYTHKIEAGKVSDTWTIPTGQGIQTKWVRFAAK